MNIKVVCFSFCFTTQCLTSYQRLVLGSDLNMKIQSFEMSCINTRPSIISFNRPFSGAPSGENLLLRWTSYLTSLSEKHSFYGTLVGKLQQKD